MILLITDGRPSAFTGKFISPIAPCTFTSGAEFKGVVTWPVGNPFPPPTNRGTSGFFIVNPVCPNNFGNGCESAAGNTVTNAGASCRFKTTPGNFSGDVSTIPAKIGPVTNTTGANVPYLTTFDSTATGYYPGSCTATNNAQCLRYAAINYADNVAKAIRLDPTYKPVIYSIGLNFNTALYPNEEPLDANFLARLANDPTYKHSITGLPVYQAGQTPGKYYDVSYSGLAAALDDITSQILRLSAF